MILAEFTIEHPVLIEPLTTVPDIEVVWEETYERSGDRPQMLFWMQAADLDAAEAALEADEAVTDPERLTELEGRRFYRVTLTEIGQETNIMPKLMAIGGVLTDAVGTAEGWTCRAWFPTRETLDELYRFCRERDLQFTLDKLYDRTTWPGEDAETYALTEKQRVVLRMAYENGYFEVPRRTTLAEIAGELDITKQAVSSRLRRALANVLGRTVFAST